MKPAAARRARARARRGEGDLLRQEILAAAERLLLQSGDAEAVSVRAIADEVGCTPPSIYLHFADKADLVFSVCQTHFEELDRYVQAAAVESEDPVERLGRIGRAYVRFGLENPEPYRVLFLTRSDLVPGTFDVEKMMSVSCFGELVATVQAGIDAGRLRQGDAFSTACLLWSALHGIVSLLINRPDFPWPDVDLPAALMQTLMRGLLADR